MTKLDSSILNRDNRFHGPEFIKRVTGGNGGECYLIFSDSKVALYDAGMAYCYKNTIENIERELKLQNRNNVDYLLVSHTHYDHIGAVPYIIKKWPGIKIIGAEKATKVFKSLNARALMKKLGEAAQESYGKGDERKESINTEDFRVDLVVHDREIIPFGNMEIQVFEMKGHTDCSLGFMILPDKVFFAPESTGVLRTSGAMTTAILKSYRQTIESAMKGKALKPNFIVSPHYGFVPDEYTDSYFDIYIDAATSEHDLINKWNHEERSKDDIYKRYEESFWNEERAMEQPIEAFKENAMHIIDVMIREK